MNGQSASTALRAMSPSKLTSFGEKTASRSIFRKSKLETHKAKSEAGESKLENRKAKSEAGNSKLEIRKWEINPQQSVMGHRGEFQISIFEYRSSLIPIT